MGDTECDGVGEPAPVASGDCASGDATDNVVRDGPNPNVHYPLRVIYCGECSLPLEYCEYSGNYEACKKWLEKNLPDEFDRLGLQDDCAEGDEGAKKKRQSRGGKAGKAGKKKQAQDQKITMCRVSRGKRKYSTVVCGLGTFDIDLKEASKFFGSRFATGASVTGTDEVVIQGDVKDDLWDIIPEKWPQVDEDQIDDLGDAKR